MKKLLLLLLLSLGFVSTSYGEIYYVCASTAYIDNPPIVEVYVRKDDSFIKIKDGYEYSYKESEKYLILYNIYIGNDGAASIVRIINKTTGDYYKDTFDGNKGDYSQTGRCKI